MSLDVTKRNGTAKDTTRYNRTSTNMRHVSASLGASRDTMGHRGQLGRFLLEYARNRNNELHSIFLGPIRFLECFYGHLRP